jgi:cold shock CspA family protein
MLVGKILSIATDKGFGFIQSATDGGADVFFHCSVVDATFDSLKIGQEVRYVLDESADKPRAKSVVTGTDVARPERRFGREKQHRPRESKPRPPLESYEFGFVTKLYRSKSQGFISSVKGGPEFLFDAANVTGEKRFFRLVIGDYVRFVPSTEVTDAKQPIAKSVMAVERYLPVQEKRPPKHPRARQKKPTWREKTTPKTDRP